MPTPPLSVTATCVHTPVGSAVAPLIRCSPAAPAVVMANRGVPELDRAVRNMYDVVLLPKSKMRCQLATVSNRIQVATVKPVAPARIPDGRATYWLVPLRFTALPARPATQPAPPTRLAVRPPPVASEAVMPDVSSKR